MRVLRLSVLVAAIALIGSQAQSAPIPWTNANGSSPGFFSWQNGANDVGLFGDPTPIANSLAFFPSNFRSQSAGGVIPISTFDKFNVDIIALPGQQIQQINILEVGDYQINGVGATTDVNVTATLVLTPMNILAAPTVANMLVAPAMPTLAGSGSWTGTATGIVSAAGVTRVHVTFDDILQARSNAGTSTTIDKKLTQGIIIQVIIPEPGTVGLLLCGAPLLLRRRRSV